MKRALLFALSFLTLPLMAQSPTLTWTPSVSTGGTVNVYRCSGAACTNFALVAPGIAAAGPFTDTISISTVPGKYVLIYYVTAVVNGVESIPSNSVALAVTVRPAPPTNLAPPNP